VSGEGAPDLEVDGSGLRVAVVAASWHREVMDGLVGNAERTLVELGVEESTVVRVPGSFELPVVAARLATSYDAVVALGVVIRGGTPHFEYVCQAVTDGLGRVALDTGVPVGFGVLTCDDEQQALDRAGLDSSRENKGREAAEAAVATAVILRGLATSCGPAPPRPWSTTCSCTGSRCATWCSRCWLSTGTGWLTASTCPPGCPCTRATGITSSSSAAYLMVDDGLNSWLRMMCSGYRKVD
jgi:6,7-dimethyl-8-ribityllumazine synthase